MRTWLKRARSSVVVFSYELLRAQTSEVLAEGETVHVVTDSEMRVARLPDKYLEVFLSAIKK